MSLRSRIEKLEAKRPNISIVIPRYRDVNGQPERWGRQLPDQEVSSIQFGSGIVVEREKGEAFVEFEKRASNEVSAHLGGAIILMRGADYL